MTTMKLPSLYVLADQYHEAAEKLAEMDLPDEVVRDTLEGLAGTIQVKSENVAIMIRQFEATAEAGKVAQAQIAARVQLITKRADRLRSYLKENMEKAEMLKVECPLFALSIKKTPGSLQITQPDLIPDEYMRMPDVPMPEPDANKIKAAINAGTEVPGCSIKKSTRLEIK